MQSLDPDFLRTFLAISETGGFAAAANAVNKTQSTVSAQVRRLEEILDARLFEKQGRRNVLTQEGRQLLEYARAIVRLNDETLRAFHPPEVSGSLRIGAPDDYAHAFLPETIASFARSFPAVEVEVVTDSSVALEPDLKSGRFDAVILSRAPGDTEMEVLRTDQLHWIGPADACERFDDPLALALWSNGCSWREMALAALTKAGRKWRIAHTTSNALLLATTVRSRLGITVAPDWFLADGLEILSDFDATYPLGKVDIGIKRRAGDPTPALAVFLDHLRAKMRIAMAEAA